MTDIVALSELSDEPVSYPALTGQARGPLGRPDRSPRLEAVLDRLPAERVRICNGLDNMGIASVAVLLATDDDRFMRAKNLGPKSREYIDKALASFGLHRVGQNPPLVVRDGASIAEAQVRRLLDWADARLKSETSLEERRVLQDMMRVLDGQEPTNERWTR